MKMHPIAETAVRGFSRLHTQLFRWVGLTGPGAFSALATFVSVDVTSDGTPRVATYRIIPPGGSWDGADTGVYTVAVEPNQV